MKKDGEVVFNFFLFPKKLPEKVTPYIRKKTTHLRLAISPEEKLALTLRFIATGESHQSLMYQYRVSHKTISRFIPEVADAIFNVLKDEYLKFSQSKQEWLEISGGIYNKLQFPNRIGAMDGKYIPIKCPKRDGSMFSNYKGFHSILLLGLVNSDYKFIFIDAGCQGRVSDGSVFRIMELYNLLVSDELNFPDSMELTESQNPAWNFTDESMSTPFVIVGDEAFPLNKHLMKPYAKIELDELKRIFNCRLSRFRCCSQKAFGIIAARFRTVNSPINSAPQKATILVLAIGNFLLTKSRGSYLSRGFVDEENLETVE